MNAGSGRIWLKFWCVGFSLAAPILAAWAAPSAFSNTNLLLINDSANSLTPAVPYPSTITVTGFTGQVITKLTVTLSGLSHTFPSDVSVLLANPQGQSAIVMSESGGQDRFSVTNLTITLDDDALNSVPADSTLVSGVFKPTNGYLDLGYPNLPYDFPAPAPSGSSNSLPTFASFKNANPNGVWSLFVICDSSGTDYGVLSNGWSMSLNASFPLQISSYLTNIVISWPAAATNWHLQSRSSFSGGNAWTNVLTTPVYSSGSLRVTNPISSTRAFYRLVGN